MAVFNGSVIIKGEAVEGFPEIQDNVSVILDKLVHYDDQIKRTERSYHRRNWTNPRRYKTAGKSRKA